MISVYIVLLAKYFQMYNQNKVCFMKTLSELFICPRCHSDIDILEDGAHCSCGAVFHKRKSAVDFRVVLEDQDRNWDSESFDSAYEKADTGFEDGMLHALNAGIPEFAENYRQDSKELPVKEFIASKHPEKLLDLGCGCGWFCYELSALSEETLFYGIDISVFRINVFKDEIRKRSSESRMECALANGEALPFPDNTFNIVVMREVLEHLQNPEATIGEIRRVLKAEGYLVITTPTKLMTDFWEAAAIIPSFIKRFLRREKLFKKPVEQVYDSPLSVSEIKKAVQNSGYEIEKWKRVIFLPHESYLQFIPGGLLKAMIKVALLIGALPFLSFLGLHHVIFLRKK